MSSEFRRTLPARADLEQQRKLAKELIAAYRRGDADARARIRAELPNKREIALADAQFVLAREYGFENWRALKEHIEVTQRDARPPIEQFKSAVERGDARTLRRVLGQHAEVRAAINQPIFGFDSPALVAMGDKPEEIGRAHV